MAISAAPFILGPSYQSANDLAKNLAALFTSGIGLDALNTDQTDQRYARLGAENQFTEDNGFGGRVFVTGVEGKNALLVSHAEDGTGSDVFGARIAASGGAGALWCDRNIAAADIDAPLVRISEGDSAEEALRVDYAGSGDAVLVDHAGGSGYGLSVAARGINVTGTSLFASAVTVSGLLSAAGGLTVASGLTVTSGGASITGALAVSGAISMGGALTGATNVVLTSATFSLQYKDHAGVNQTKTIYAP